MKQTILALLAVLFAATGAYCQIDAGIRDSRYVYGSYTFKGFTAALEHSLYSEKMGFQRIGIYAGYEGYRRELHYSAYATATTTWNGNYQTAGLLATAYYNIGSVSVGGTINPLYDSGLKYKTCFRVGAAVRICSPISVLAYYTTIPDYRMSEKRIAGGFDFHSDNLSVRPQLSLSVEQPTRFKNLRMLMSMNYRF